MSIGLALSGGGIRGIAHIGVIKALEEHDIHPTHIAGTSAGAIVGALYARGASWKEIYEFFENTQIFSIKNFARGKPGFVDAEKFYDHFRSYFTEDSFKALAKPLFVTATDILNGSLKVFRNGELIRPLLASAAFPGLFAPIKVGDGYYADGGILNNFPVDVIKPYCDQVIGVYANSFNKVDIAELKHSYDIMERAYKIRMSKDALAKFKDCSLVISPKNLSRFSTFSKKDMRVIFEIGHQAAHQALRTFNPPMPYGIH
ncbi:MAG: patatin-like phospholipase family protein [Flavobacteriaceae bacterium]